MFDSKKGTVHALANPGQTPTIGIHVYLGDLVKQERSMFHPESLREEPFVFARLFEYERQFGRSG